MAIGSLGQWRSRSVVALAASAVYLYGFPSANIPYILVLLFHLVAGIFLTILLLPFLVKMLPRSSPGARVGWLMLALGAVTGVTLIFTGTPLGMKWLLYSHILACLLGVTLLAGSWLASGGWLGMGGAQMALRSAALLVVVAGISAGTWWYRTHAWNNAYRITNPAISPSTMDEEGDGPQGRLFPSSAQTKDP